MLKSAIDAHVALTLAVRHARNGSEMESSAVLCMNDAAELMEVGNYDCAVARARDSLAYSVGIFHNDYKAAAAI